MAIDVSIIFVNYHTSHLICDCLKSIVENVKDVVYEIIVVDNDSEKDLDATLSPIVPEGIRIHYVYLDKNIGFGRANNEGAKYAQGENLFFLNPDTVLLNNALKILSDFLKSHPKAAVCGGNLTDSEDRPAHSFRKIFPGISWDFQEFTHFIFSYPKNSRKRFFNFSSTPMRVAYISGADLMVRTNIFRECGGFADEFFMYWDDVELCRRIIEAGYYIYSVPQAHIRHLESRSFENVARKNSFKIELQEKYRCLYFKKNIGAINSVISNIFYRWFLESRILFSSKTKKDYYKQRKEFFTIYKNPHI